LTFNPLILPDTPTKSPSRRYADAPHMKLWDYIKVCLQVGVLVWGAATITAKVNELAITTTSLTTIISSLQITIQQLQVQNARIEVRLDNLEKRDIIR